MLDEGRPQLVLRQAAIGRVRAEGEGRRAEGGGRRAEGRGRRAVLSPTARDTLATGGCHLTLSISPLASKSIPSNTWAREAKE